MELALDADRLPEDAHGAALLTHVPLLGISRFFRFPQYRLAPVLRARTSRTNKHNPARLGINAHASILILQMKRTRRQSVPEALHFALSAKYALRRRQMQLFPLQSIGI